MSVVAIGTCGGCGIVKDFTIESVLYRRNQGKRFSYQCFSCSGTPTCSLCDDDNCPLYSCVVCRKEDRKVCERCNDRHNHSEIWKCGTCKNKRTDREEYLDYCIQYHDAVLERDWSGDARKLSQDKKAKHERVESLEKELAVAKSLFEQSEKALTLFLEQNKQVQTKAKVCAEKAKEVYKRMKQK